ncbi:MAG: hypothetical protein AB8H79_10230 [Myxococcota bacterium]
MRLYLLPLLTLGCAPVLATVEPISTPSIEGEPNPIDDEWDWTATLYIGGLDRVVVVGSREASPQCLTLRLVWPGWPNDAYRDLDLPEEWGVEGAGMSDGPCEDKMGGDVYDRPITQMTGRIRFEDGYPPPSLSIEAVAEGEDWGPVPLTADVDITE